MEAHKSERWERCPRRPREPAAARRAAPLQPCSRSPRPQGKGRRSAAGSPPLGLPQSGRPGRGLDPQFIPSPFPSRNLQAGLLPPLPFPAIRTAGVALEEESGMRGERDAAGRATVGA